MRERKKMKNRDIQNALAPVFSQKTIQFICARIERDKILYLILCLTFIAQ